MTKASEEHTKFWTQIIFQVVGIVFMMLMSAVAYLHNSHLEKMDSKMDHIHQQVIDIGKEMEGIKSNVINNERRISILEDKDRGIEAEMRGRFESMRDWVETFAYKNFQRKI